MAPRTAAVDDDPAVKRYFRIEREQDIPAADPRAVDVVVLDMNHGWPNLGHNSLVHAILEGDAERLAAESALGIYCRVLSYDVRRCAMVPAPPGAEGGRGGRFAVYLGTGGPGHLDPRRNDGVAPESQGLDEDPSWEAPLFRLFDAIHADRDAALLAVCHTFGVLCRWSGVAQPVLRGPEKGGKSSGVLENLWTAEAAAHPWLGGFVQLDGRRPRIVDNRLFDLVEEPRPLPAGCQRIGHDTLGIGGPDGGALTMMEFARDRAGVMPRIFGVNHHPEVVDRDNQLTVLEEMALGGDVSEAWVAERRDILTRRHPDEDSDSRLRRTSECTLFGPLRFHLYRQLRLRAEALRLPAMLHEDQVIEADAAVVRTTLAAVPAGVTSRS